MSDINTDNSDLSQNIESIVKSSFAINGVTQKRINRSVRIASIVMIVLGVIMLIGYIATDVKLSTLAEAGRFDRYDDYKFLLNILLWCGAILLVIGMFFIVFTNATSKHAEKLNQENFYAFYEEYFTITTRRKEEELGTVKQYYSDMHKVRENKKFFLLYPNSATVFPVEKEKLTEEEIVRLRELLSLKKR